MIYPVPEPGGLGVHLTLDLAGQAKFGPDVKWLPDTAQEDYAPDLSRADAFESSIRQFWPSLPAQALMPSYSGIRSKLNGPGEPAADFYIARDSDNIINCLGIESPGLTASLAIAEYVTALANSA